MRCGIGVRGLTFCLLFLALWLPRRVRAAEDPERQWQSEKRGQVVLLFAADTKHLVRPTWDALSRSMRRIEELFGWTLPDELTVVITDHVDTSNGWARVTPYPDIHLLAFPPPLDSSLAGPGSWWERLILHELLHVLHLLQAGGIHEWLNRVLGPMDYPNTRLPSWFKEGLAVWVESQEAWQGRLNHPRFLGRKRVTLLEQSELPLDRLTTGPIEPPAGTAAYMFGGAFLQHLIKHHGGVRKMRGFVERYGGLLLPFGLNTALKDVAGIDFVQSYKEFMEEEQAEAAEKAVGRGGLDEVGHAVVKEILSIRDLSLRPGDLEFAAVENDGHQESQLTLRRSSDGSLIMSQPCEGGCDGGMSLSADGRTAIASTVTPVGPIRASGDLYAYTFEKPTAPERWTHDAHLARPDAHRFPEKPVLAIRTRQGRTEIVTLEGPGDTPRVLLGARDGVRVDMPKWSNHGERLVFVEMDHKESRLVLWEPKQSEKVVLARSNWPFIHPVFDSGDQSIYVSGVTDGVYDVLEIRIETGAIVQRTRSIGGTAYPMPLDNKALLFADMRGLGWSVQRLESKNARTRAVPDHWSGSKTEEFPPLRTELVSAPSLVKLARPRSVSPTAQYATGQGLRAGITLFGADPIPHHQWSFFLQGLVAKEGRYRLPDWGISYVYGGFPVDISFDWVDIYRHRLGFDGATFHGADGRYRSAQLGLWHNQRDLLSTDAVGLSLGLRQDAVDNPFLRPDPGGGPPLWLENEFRPALGLHLRHYGRRRVRYGSVAQYGFSLGTSVHFEPTLSPHRSERWRLAWHFLAPMVLSHKKHVVLTHRFHGRLSFAPFRSREVFRLGGLETTNLFLDFVEDRNIGYEALRGFPLNAFKGHHVQRWTMDLSFRSWDILRGLNAMPVALRRLVPALFADAGWIGPYRSDQRDLHLGLGAEFRMELELGYGVRPLLRAGLAHGIGPEGITQAYLVWGSRP